MRDEMKEGLLAAGFVALFVLLFPVVFCALYAYGSLVADFLARLVGWER